MTKRTGRLLMVLVAVALPAAVVMAPSAAVGKKAKKVNLQGPINKPKDPGYTPLTHNCCFPSYVPTIQIEAKFNKSKVKVTQYGLWGPCSGAEYSDGESKQEFTGKLRKNGRFAGSSTQYGTDTLTVSGQILRNGTASGIVREVEVRQNMGPGYAWGTCDSGTVTWTASKVKDLTDPKKGYDPSLIYPAGL